MTVYSVLDRGVSSVELVTTWATPSGWESSVAVEFPAGSGPAAGIVAAGLSRLSVTGWEAVVDGEWDDQVSDAVVAAIDGSGVDVDGKPVVVREAHRVGQWVHGTAQQRLVRAEVIREVDALNRAVRGDFTGRSYQVLMCGRRYVEAFEISTVHKWFADWTQRNGTDDLRTIVTEVATLSVREEAKACAVAEWLAAVRLIAESMGSVGTLPSGDLGEAVSSAVVVHGRPLTGVAAGAAAIIGSDRVMVELVDAFAKACAVLAGEHGGSDHDVAAWVAGAVSNRRH